MELLSPQGAPNASLIRNVMLSQVALHVSDSAKARAQATRNFYVGIGSGAGVSHIFSNRVKGNSRFAQPVLQALLVGKAVRELLALRHLLGVNARRLGKPLVHL